MFNLNDYVRCVEPGFTLRVGAVYRVIAMDGTLCRVQGCTAGATWAVDRFIPWTPQVNDTIRFRGHEARIIRADHEGFFILYPHGNEDYFKTNWLLRDGNDEMLKPVPVLNRAPYSEGEKEKRSKPICVNCLVNPPQGGGSPLCESCYRAKDAAKAAADFYGECDCKAYGHDKTHMRHCVHHVGPDAANKPVAPEIKVPLGSTPTDEKLRREREERRAADAKAKLKRMDDLQTLSRLEEIGTKYMYSNTYCMLTGHVRDGA